MAVKEQWIDNSKPTFLCSLKYSMQRRCLRFILVDFERNYQMRVLSKSVIEKRLFSSQVHPSTSNNFKINPSWVTGFVDAEGCFTIIINRSNNLKVGWRVRTYFIIGLHVKDRVLLENIKNFFGYSRRDPRASQEKFIWPPQN